MAAKPPPELNAILTQRTEVAPGLLVLRVIPHGWELPDFVPGQYIVLGLPGSAARCEGADPEQPQAEPGKLIRRAYSIASSSLARDYLEFYVALVGSGTLTPRLFALEVGDRLWIGRKTVGMFTLDQVPTTTNVVLFATGTGIAPYMSMVRTVIGQDVERRFVAVHGARHSWDLGYQSELISLQRRYSRFSYVPIISRPNEELIRWNGLTGYCQDVWRNRVVDELWGVRPSPEDTRIFLCGNPAMIEDMLSILAADGFREHSKKSPGEVHLEKYW